MARRPPRIAPGDFDYIPTDRDEQLAHAQALRRNGDQYPDERADYYTEAAEYYAMAGEDTTAEELFQAALADGGDVVGGVHGYYACFLLDRGRDGEALAVIDVARKLRPDDTDVFSNIAEVLNRHGHHSQAAAWATRGLVSLFGGLTDIEPDDLLLDPDGRLLAADRLRARRNAGLAADHIDEVIAPIVDARGHEES